VNLLQLKRSVDWVIRLFHLVFYSSSTKKRWVSRNRSSAIDYLNHIEGAGSDFLLKYFNLSQINSFLEIGSNCGNRLFPLANRYPNTQFVGVDINLEAIEVGKEYINKYKIENVILLHLDITSEEFGQFLKRRTFQIIFTWATLMYLHPRDLTRLLSKIIASSERIVFIEQYFNSHKIKVISSIPARSALQWKHDYFSKLQGLTSENTNITIYLKPVAKSIWNPHGGGGAIIDMEQG
jgi:trans-aconitate methyltransferase